MTASSRALLCYLFLLPAVSSHRLLPQGQRRIVLSSDKDNIIGCSELNCQNGGYCEILTVTEEHLSTIPQRCICQPGFGGLECEIETSVCYTIFSEDRYCQAGAPCLVTKDGRDYCDCGQGYDASAFAGLECEFSATEYCTEDGRLSKKAFCVNGGNCLGYISDDGGEEVHPGCECNRGYEGEHCEYLKGQMPPKSSEAQTYAGSGHKVFHGFLIAAFGVSLLVLGMVIVKWYQRKHNAGRTSQSSFDSPVYIG